MPSIFYARARWSILLKSIKIICISYDLVILINPYKEVQSCNIFKDSKKFNTLQYL